MVNGVKCLFGLGKKRTEIYSTGLTARVIGDLIKKSFNRVLEPKSRLEYVEL